MSPLQEHELLLTRRHFFGRMATGIGVAALGSDSPKGYDGATEADELQGKWRSGGASRGSTGTGAGPR